MTNPENRQSRSDMAALLEAEGLLRDSEGAWVRPDAPGIPQPEVTEYGTAAEAVRRLLAEARGEAVMAWGAEREARERANRLGEALEMARGFLGMAIRSPRSAAWVADEALVEWRKWR